MSREARGVVLLYHRIAAEADPWRLAVSPANFKAHLDILRRSWNPVALPELVGALANGTVEDRSVAVTFDDGYADNLGAAQLLRGPGIDATFFVITGALGEDHEFWSDELDRLVLWPGRLPPVLELSIGPRTYRWELGSASDYDGEARRRHARWGALEEPPTERHALYQALYGLLQPLSDPERDHVMNRLRHVARPAAGAAAPMHRALSPDELTRLAALDHVEIGSHTQTHPILASLPPARQAHELAGSKRALEDLLRREIMTFSYPYGGPEHYSAQTAELARGAGYRCACAAAAGLVDATTDPFAVPRTAVPDCDGDAFAALLEQTMSVRA